MKSLIKRVIHEAVNVIVEKIDLPKVAEEVQRKASETLEKVGIDYEELSMRVNLNRLARVLNYEEIELDYSAFNYEDVASNIDLSDLASQVSATDLAAEIEVDYDELAGRFTYKNIADEFDVEELANELVSRLPPREDLERLASAGHDSPVLVNKLLSLAVDRLLREAERAVSAGEI